MVACSDRPLFLPSRTEWQPRNPAPNQTGFGAWLDGCHPRTNSPLVNSEGVAKQVVAVFVVTLIIYVVGFSWLEHRRVVKGPWNVAFATDDGGHPALTISQAALGISNVTVRVSDKTITNRLGPTLVSFATVTNVPPFGDMPYFDATFLPGALTFNLLGHEIELLPRTLKVDLQEMPWVNGTNYTLSGPGKYQPRKKSRY